jgi:hypothetical protein
MASCFILLGVLGSGVVLIVGGDYSLAHTQHSVNLLDTKPVKNIGHQRLEPHVFDTRNILGSFEIL